MLRRLRRFQTERGSEIPFPPQNRARRSHRNSKLARDHFRLSSLAGTRRAEKHESSFHLATVKKNGYATNNQNRDANIKPHEHAMPSRFAAIVRCAIKTASANPALAQKSIVMPLN